ncbi:hypothetical protein CVT25_013365 [Psilocybe cyanescens]|uniref:Uncharacterized protein n=1 Tax=Psilocybe cyanescens TaxID=93625 RepID=A0A409WSI1_PSICY|nr:hypothetical protein CVT25_013365 [Psilocybe cyanescens]
MDEETSDSENVDADADAVEVKQDLKRTSDLELGAHPGARALAPHAPSPFLKILSSPPSSFSSARTAHTSYTPSARHVPHFEFPYAHSPQSCSTLLIIGLTPYLSYAPLRPVNGAVGMRGNSKEMCAAGTGDAWCAWGVFWGHG